MIINIRNWGAVGHISIDTDKPLIVMCGPNSTGKTYVSYLLYALFSKTLRSSDYMYNYIKCSVTEDIKTNILNTHSFELTESYIGSILKDTADSIKNHLIPSIFAISEEMAKMMFRELVLDIGLGDGEFRRIVAKKRSFVWLSGGYKVRMEKQSDSTFVNVYVTDREDEEISDLSSVQASISFDKIITSALLDIAFDNKGFSRMLTVERNSVYTFSKELSLNRGFGMGDPVALKSGRERLTPERYPMAVTDSLKIAVDMQQIQKSRGFYYEYASRLERNLLNGDIEINDNGAVEFIPTGVGTKAEHHLPIQMTSSIVKTMSSLILYLKHIADKDDLLIIDEPEMNLHPDNQCLLTRIFAELINKGLNIVVSTHSDYIIRELNNLIMANEICEKKIKLEDGETVPYTRRQMLSRKETEVLYFRFDGNSCEVSGQDIPVTEFGFDVASIDATIVAQNDVTHNLADILKYGEPNE